MASEIPEAAPGANPGLEIAGAAATTDSHSIGGESGFSVVSTTLEGKGLDGTPVAEKHNSRRTGKPYWRFRTKNGRFVKKETVAELGFAWYPRAADPTKGMLKSIKTGKTVKFEDAKERLAQFQRDIANMSDVNEDDVSETGEGLDAIKEEGERNKETGAPDENKERLPSKPQSNASKPGAFPGHLLIWPLVIGVIAVASWHLFHMQSA